MWELIDIIIKWGIKKGSSYELPLIFLLVPGITSFKEVESAGIEPASKHILRKLSTCLFMYCCVGTQQEHN